MEAWLWDKYTPQNGLKKTEVSKIIRISNEDSLMKIAEVSFGGTIKEVNLAYAPEANVGDYVIVHVGFAISILNEKEALKVFETLDQIDEFQNSEGSQT